MAMDDTSRPKAWSEDELEGVIDDRISAHDLANDDRVNELVDDWYDNQPGELWTKDEIEEAIDDWYSNQEGYLHTKDEIIDIVEEALKEEIPEVLVNKVTKIAQKVVREELEDFFQRLVGLQQQPTSAQ